MELKDWFIRGQDITRYYSDQKGHWRAEHKTGIQVYAPPNDCIEVMR